jgi:hypothetical protein
MKGQWEVMEYKRDLVRSRRFFHQRRGAATIGALQILEDYDSHLRPFGRTQCGIHRLLRGAQGSNDDASRKN